MELLVQTAGSLAAILALAGLAWWMKLGGAPLLDTDDAVRRAASEVEDGFEPVAIARDGQSRFMVIKRHGNRFAGRVLDRNAAATLNIDPVETLLVVRTGQTLFGDIYLEIDDPKAWADAINRVNAAPHA